MNYRPIVCLFLFSCLVRSAFAQPDAAVAPIQKLEDIKPMASAFRAAGWTRPIVIRDQQQAAEYFQKAQLATLLKEVDFQKQIVLVFAWRGSGQDRIDYSVLESFPEQVVFNYAPGRTRDLRRNAAVFALRSNITWKINDQKPNDQKPNDQKPNDQKPDPTFSGEYIKVEVRGKLNSQVVAIGGETTGIEIQSSGITFELNFTRNPHLRKVAKALHGSVVVARGELTAKAGTERAKRWMLAVDALKAAGAADAAGSKNPYLTSKGLLRHSLVLRDSQSGFAGESGHVWAIAPNGAWNRRTFLNKDLGPLQQQGQLTQVQLGKLANQLAKAEFSQLPQQLGEDPGVNPYVVTLSFGQKETSLYLPGGTPLRSAFRNRPPSPERRFLSIVLLILDCTNADQVR